ncbi:hypothetical protein EV182_007424, partial [Spiromyces aspiralis]
MLGTLSWDQARIEGEKVTATCKCLEDPATKVLAIRVGTKLCAHPNVNAVKFVQDGLISIIKGLNQLFRHKPDLPQDLRACALNDINSFNPNIRC